MNSKRVDLVQRHSDLPEKLYRYMPININTITALSQNYLWFSHPDTFNDPFDGVIYLDGQYSEDTIKQFLKIAINDSDMSIEILETAYNNYIEDPEKQDLFNKGVQEALWNKTKDSYKVCCFSRQPDKILMWSHYARGHTGMCLGYDREFLSNHCIENGMDIFPMKYCLTMTKSNFEKDQNIAIYNAFRHKYNKWEYEEEWRAFIKGTEHKIHFDSSALKYIIFGCKAPLSQKKTIRNILGDSVKYYKVVMDGNKYQLIIEDENFEEASMFSQFVTK